MGAGKEEAMSMASMRALIGVVALALGPAGGAVVALAAEEETVRALAAWQGQGKFFPVGLEEAMFVGEFGGIFFVEDRRGALDAARIVCPGTILMHRITGAATGEGRCVLTDRDNHRAFARWTCAGVFGIGCRGRFTLTEGTGRLRGITGEGELFIRSTIVDLANQASDDTVRETAAGIAVWPSLRYRIP
jgi:hypothetical protein